MDVKDSISVTLKTIDGKETKDQSAKNIFSYKPIMSNILKYYNIGLYDDGYETNFKTGKEKRNKKIGHHKITILSQWLIKHRKYS